MLEQATSASKKVIFLQSHKGGDYPGGHKMLELWTKLLNDESTKNYEVAVIITKAKDVLPCQLDIGNFIKKHSQRICYLSIIGQKVLHLDNLTSVYPKLKALEIIQSGDRHDIPTIPIKLLPKGLKFLNLNKCFVPWRLLNQLPNIEILRLLNLAGHDKQNASFLWKTIVNPSKNILVRIEIDDCLLDRRDRTAKVIEKLGEGGVYDLSGCQIFHPGIEDNSLTTEADIEVVSNGLAGLKVSGKVHAKDQHAEEKSVEEGRDYEKEDDLRCLMETQLLPDDSFDEEEESVEEDCGDEKEDHFSSLIRTPLRPDDCFDEDDDAQSLSDDSFHEQAYEVEFTQPYWNLRKQSTE